MSCAGFAFSPRGNMVFREGDEGDCMYILLHGQCKAIIHNKSFLEARRELRDDMHKLYAAIAESIRLEA